MDFERDAKHVGPIVSLSLSRRRSEGCLRRICLRDAQFQCYIYEKRVASSVYKRIKGPNDSLASATHNKK